MAHELSASDAYTVFLDRWQRSEAAERANYVLFLTELCEVLDLPRPEPTAADERANTYVFEKAVTFHNVDGSVAVDELIFTAKPILFWKRSRAATLPRSQPGAGPGASRKANSL